MKHEAAKENLRDVVKALNAVKAYWWIDAGTCLGAIREHAFIDHDEDIDIGIHGDEVAQELAVLLAQKGFEVNHIFGQKGNGYELAMQRDGVKVDFFFYDHNDDRLTVSLWKQGKQIFLDHSAYLFENLAEIDFLGIKVKTPHPVEEYLTERYGDWKTVVKKWDWANDPKNIRHE